MQIGLGVLKICIWRLWGFAVGGYLYNESVTKRDLALEERVLIIRVRALDVYGLWS